MYYPMLRILNNNKHLSPQIVDGLRAIEANSTIAVKWRHSKMAAYI